MKVVGVGEEGGGAAKGELNPETATRELISWFFLSYFFFNHVSYVAASDISPF
jgi:hypothetical protein